MEHQHNNGAHGVRCSERVPTPDETTRLIFETLVKQEARAGRLNRRARARLARYAANLDISAVELGELIQRSRADATNAAHAATPLAKSPPPHLRLAGAPSERRSCAIMTAILGALLIDLAILLWWAG